MLGSHICRQGVGRIWYGVDLVQEIHGAGSCRGQTHCRVGLVQGIADTLVPGLVQEGSPGAEQAWCRAAG